jgi:hypothetical protein
MSSRHMRLSSWAALRSDSEQFQNTETPCFDIKAEQPKQTSCFRKCRN